MNNIKIYNPKMFDDIKHIDNLGNEYWEARELMHILQYNKWENFHKVIKQAIIACKNSNHKVLNHFPDVRKMVNIGSKTSRKILDYHLTRYACYLIVQNCDPRKEVISFAQTYFAIQTRKQELLEEKTDILSETEKRIYIRNLTKKGNYSLNQTAKIVGVKNFDKFHNAGYKGLYNGETANDIAKRKNLRYREDILDNMGSTELAANLFRITQTDEKLKNDNIKGENNANKTHYEMGRDIRNFIKSKGGTLPENLPTPKQSLKEITKKSELDKELKR